MILSNMLRPGVVPPVSFPNPIQRPVGGVMPGVQPARPQRPIRPQSTPVASVANPRSVSDMKANQRRALLAHTQSFLNPNNKPRKSKVEVSAKDEKISILSPESSIDIKDEEKK